MPADRRNKICEAANCDTLKPVYTWPQDPQQAEAWKRFVRKKVVSFTPGAKSGLCYKHFDKQSFHNYGPWELKLDQRLMLDRATAIPTIQLEPETISQSESPSTIPMLSTMLSSNIPPPNYMSKRGIRALLRDALKPKDTRKPYYRNRSITTKPAIPSQKAESTRAARATQATQTSKRICRAKKRSKAIQCDLLDAPPLKFGQPKGSTADYVFEIESDEEGSFEEQRVDHREECGL